MEVSRVVSLNNRPNKISENLKGSFKNTLDETQKRLKDEKLYKAASQLEGLFIEQMIKALRSTIHREDSLLYGGQAEDIFQEMLDQKYAELISNSANLGLAQKIYNQMLKVSK